MRLDYSLIEVQVFFFYFRELNEKKIINKTSMGNLRLKRGDAVS